MKRFLVVMLLVGQCFSAFAASQYDGIYFCTVSTLAGQLPAYVTVNTNASGGTIWAVAAVTQTSAFYGYGIGQIVGTAFTGQTNFLGSFQLQASSAAMTGTVQLYSSAGFSTGNVSCSKIW